MAFESESERERSKNLTIIDGTNALQKIDVYLFWLRHFFHFFFLKLSLYVEARRRRRRKKKSGSTKKKRRK